MAKYRIRFHAKFNQIVTADNAKEARRIADELTQTPVVAVAEADSVECAWSIIEFVESD